MTSVTIPLTEELKLQMETSLDALGLTWAEFVSESFKKQWSYESELLEAAKECEDILNNPSSARWFTDVDEFLEDLKS